MILLLEQKGINLGLLDVEFKARLLIEAIFWKIFLFFLDLSQRLLEAGLFNRGFAFINLLSILKLLNFGFLWRKVINLIVVVLIFLFQFHFGDYHLQLSDLSFFVENFSFNFLYFSLGLAFSVVFSVLQLLLQLGYFYLKLLFLFRKLFSFIQNITVQLVN